MFYVSEGRRQIQTERMLELLRQTYWAKERTLDQMELAIDHSVCYGAYLEDNDQQIGLVRVMTDFVSAFYLCDVIVDPQYRGLGVAKAMLEAVMADTRFSHLRGFLVTSDAHGLYGKFGFVPANERHMGREPQK